MLVSDYSHPTPHGGRCRIRIYEAGGELPVVVCTEPKDNEGMTARGPVPLVAGVLLAGTSPALCVAPFADAAAMLVGEGRRDRVLSVVSTETTFGLAAAGPVVLLTAVGGPADGGQGWRYAWAAFAAAAFLVALWNARLLPGEPYRGRALAAPGAGRASTPGGSCTVDRPPCWGRRSPTA